MENRRSLNCALGAFAMTLTLACAPLNASESERLRASLDVEVLHETNVNRATAPDPERSDTILAAELYGTHAFLLSPRSGVVTRSGVNIRAHSRYSDMSSASVFGRADFRYQHNPGFTGTVFQGSVALDAVQHLDSRIRDSIFADLSLSAGKHLTDRVRLGMGIGQEWREARNDVYDTSAARIWGTVDYRLQPRTALYGRSMYIDGDQVFNTAYGGTEANLMMYARASAPDPALKKAFGGMVPTAYRVDATTWSHDLGINHALDGLRSLDFSVGYFDAEARKAAASYDGWQVRLMYLYRFR